MNSLDANTEENGWIWDTPGPTRPVRRTLPLDFGKPAPRFTFWQGYWHDVDSPELPAGLRKTTENQSKP